MSVTPNFPPNGRDLGDDNGNNNPVFLYGDLNDDGVVNSLDISLLGRYILEITDGFVVPIEAADLNGDGIINTNDYTIMRRYNGNNNRVSSREITKQMLILIMHIKISRNEKLRDIFR